MSYLLAFLGFAALIILHEFGHFAAAKAVGMRVERFSLFFGPLLVKWRRGETEYGIGPIPLGGYVRITGMNPNEQIPEEHADRAYYRQPVWKRIVVILAGPVMNLLIAFALLFGVIWNQGKYVETTSVAPPSVSPLRQPAKSILQPGDRIVSVNGVSGGPKSLQAAVNSHKCAGKLTQGCAAAVPLRVVIDRHGARKVFHVRPRYDRGAGRMLIGFSFDSRHESVGPVNAASLSVSSMWNVTTKTVSIIGRIFVPKERKQLHSVVGSYRVTQESFSTSTSLALQILALISLSLAIVNLFPFLPLDGGHIFWAVAEKVRGRAIPFSVMERASVVGFALVLMVFVIGLTNDIHDLTNGGLQVR